MTTGELALPHAAQARPAPTSAPALATRTRRLPLFWKLLLPYLALIVIIGLLSAFLLVRNLTSQASADLDAELTRRALDARAAVQTRELSLLESGDFAANLQGMAPAVASREAAATTRLLSSVLALKTDLTLAAVTGLDGQGLSELRRERPGAEPVRTQATRWAEQPFVARVLQDRRSKEVGLLTVGGRPHVALASPICGGTTTCNPVGVAVVGIPLADLAAAALGEGAPGEGAALYGATGALLARAGEPAVTTPTRVAGDEPVRRLSGSGEQQRATLSAPLLLQGRELGTLDITLPAGEAFSSVRDAAVRVALAVLAAMVGIVAIGALLSRSILRQLRPVLASVRAIGTGDFTTRVPASGGDEIGELATGFNTMAERLQSSYDELERRVEERTAEVQRLLEERTQVFAGISHELRTPVAIVLSQAQMLADTSVRKSPQWQAGAGQVLQASGQQLLSFVSDVLELARTETEEPDLELSRVAVGALLQDLAPTVRGLGAAHGVTVRVARPRSLPAVVADPGRLRQVLLQLVDNAVKYTPAGGSVRLDASADGRALRIEVADTGIGIPAEHLPRLFDPFYRVRGNHTQGGQPSSGLGLAITRRLVEAQGGTIGVTSQVGSGTTVTLSMPLAP